MLVFPGKRLHCNDIIIGPGEGRGHLAPFDLTDPAGSWLHRNIMEFPMASEPGLRRSRPPRSGCARTRPRSPSHSTTARPMSFPPNSSAFSARAPRSRAIRRTSARRCGGKRHVTIIEVHPVGNYAVRLGFDDMHSTGIYSWDYFLKLGRDSGPLLARISRRTRRQGLVARTGAAEMNAAAVIAPGDWCYFRRYRSTTTLVPIWTRL